ncbi:hypothetical protein G6F68_011334 [Rhizopus microsporus]|nr:hypothetical protein G6F68_011334 [Rhizopus microsporus]
MVGHFAHRAAIGHEPRVAAQRLVLIITATVGKRVVSGEVPAEHPDARDHPVGGIAHGALRDLVEVPDVDAVGIRRSALVVAGGNLPCLDDPRATIVVAQPVFHRCARIGVHHAADRAGVARSVGDPVQRGDVIAFRWIGIGAQSQCHHFRCGQACLGLPAVQPSLVQLGGIGHAGIDLELSYRPLGAAAESAIRCADEHEAQRTQVLLELAYVLRDRQRRAALVLRCLCVRRRGRGRVVDATPARRPVVRRRAIVVASSEVVIAVDHASVLDVVVFAQRGDAGKAGCATATRCARP